LLKLGNKLKTNETTVSTKPNLRTTPTSPPQPHHQRG
jgi:hypothetical protein